MIHLAAEPTDTERWLYAAQDEIALRCSLARQAQDAWAKTPPTERARVLSRVADTLLARSDEIARRISEETGKRRTEAVAHEILTSVMGVRWLTERGPSLLEDERVPLRAMPNRTAIVRHEPLGLALVISPWNFPLSIPLGQVVAGLLAGNAVVLKPSEVTPATGRLIEELIASAGLPLNLFSVVQGDGRVGAHLIDQRPDKVFFTGSLATGRKVMAQAAKFPIPVCLELGGVDAMIVCDDADVEFASSAAVWGAMFNGGQVCASVERLLVQSSIKDIFVQAMRNKIARLDPETDLGRVIAPAQDAVYERHLADARARGLDVLCGGHALRPGVFAPTVIEGPSIADAAVYNEETFGPIVAVHTFRTDDEAIALHNASDFGLTASVFSGSSERASRIADGVRAGLVSINDVGATLYGFAELPWGGVNGSGYGRSHGAEGLREFTWPKVIDRSRTGVPDFKRPWWFPYDEAQSELLRHFAYAMGGRGARERLGHAAKLGRSLVSMLTRRPRL